MEEDFYSGVLRQRGIEVLVPDAQDRGMINDVIFQELCLGRIEDGSRRKMLTVIEGLQARGAQGVVLGCTEIGLLVQPEHTDVPLLDTTLLHATAAAEMALGR